MPSDRDQRFTEDGVTDRLYASSFSALLSALPAGLRDTGWFTTKIEGDEQQIVNAVEQICSKLGTVVHGRGGVELETIAPSPRELAHPRSLSAVHGLGTFPLHVELSHRIRPCRYVVLACLNPGIPSVATALLDRNQLAFSSDEKAMLRNAVVLVRSGRRSFYSSILPADEAWMRFDIGCMEAFDARGRTAIGIVEERLTRSSPTLHHWIAGGILVIDNWRVLHGRTSAEGAVGRRLSRMLIDG
jgi:hypothetical protein